MENSERKPYRGRWNDRRRAAQPRAEIPEIPVTAAGELTPKHLGYLHVHCGLSPSDIVGRYPKRLNLHLVHLGLADYYKNQETLEAELKSERKFNAGGSLNGSGMSLPRVGLASLVEAENAFQAVAEADRKRDEARAKPRLR